METKSMGISRVLRALRFDSEEADKSLKRRNRDARYFSEHYKKFQGQFPDELVAILDQRVVGHHKTLYGLAKLLNEEGISGEYIRRVYVMKKPKTYLLDAF